MPLTPLIHLLLAAALIAPISARGTDHTPASERDAGIHFDRLALLGSTALAVRYLGFEYFDRAWYQGQETDRIRWIYDWGGDTYVNLDKGGHFMGGAFMAQKLSEAYAWAGFGQRTAAALGTATSWAALLEIEMRDAHFDQWGFSVPDFLANTLGASLPLLHAFFPRSRAVQLKFSYHPSRLFLDRDERAALDRPNVQHLIDDYEGMAFWLSFPIDPLLRRFALQEHPNWIRLAIGYGATGLHGSNAKSRGRFRLYPDRPEAQPELFLALDYDARALPGDAPLWRYFKRQLDWLHWPAPAVRVYPDLRFYLLFM